MADEKIKESVIKDATLLKLVGFKPIIVHGGGKEISKWVKKAGMVPEFVNGLRKTDAATMQDFKEKKAVHLGASASGHDRNVLPVIAKLNEEKYGWYEGAIDFKRVLLVPGTGKFQYRDTRFVARVKAESGIDCYNRIVEHLQERVDARSQFPSAKGKNFKFRYLGLAK